MHKALTYLNLPPANRKAPGDKITKAEWDECDPPQTEEDIQALIDGGSISDDMDAPVHPAHLPVDPGKPNIEQMIELAKNMVSDLGEENVPKEILRLSKIEHTHVGGTDAGAGGDSHA